MALTSTMLLQLWVMVSMAKMSTLSSRTLGVTLGVKMDSQKSFSQLNIPKKVFVDLCLTELTLQAYLILQVRKIQFSRMIRTTLKESQSQAVMNSAWSAKGVFANTLLMSYMDMGTTQSTKRNLRIQLAQHLIIV